MCTGEPSLPHLVASVLGSERLLGAQAVAFYEVQHLLSRSLQLFVLGEMHVLELEIVKLCPLGSLLLILLYGQNLLLELGDASLIHHTGLTFSRRRWTSSIRSSLWTTSSSSRCFLCCSCARMSTPKTWAATDASPRLTSPARTSSANCLKVFLISTSSEGFWALS